MILPLFMHELRSCLFPTFIIAAVAILYAGVIVGMYDPALGESLALMRDAMPELFAAFGMADQGTTLLEFMVNYLYGFLLVALPLVLVAVLTAFELACAQALFPGELDASDLVAANAATFCLWLFLSGMCWAGACALPNVSAARWAGVALCTLFVLAQMLSGVGDELSWIGDVTPLALFDPLGVASGNTGALAGAAALGVSGAVLFALGTIAFVRRDLSV